MRRRVGRALTGLLLTSILGASLAPTVNAAPSASPCAIKDVGGWSQISLPDFGAGEQVVASYTVDAYDEHRLFVTNGFAVFRSMDGGCGWEEVYRLPELPTADVDYSAKDSRIKQVVIPAGTTSGNIVFLTINQFDAPDPARGARPRVLRSENNGNKWVAAEGELPDNALFPHGRPEQLLPTPSFPKVLYFLAESAAVQYFQSSPDGGKTWTREGPVCIGPDLGGEVDTPLGPIRGPGVGCSELNDTGSSKIEIGGASDFNGIAVDPYRPNDLWFYGKAGLRRSMNSGKNAEAIEAVEVPIAAVDVWRAAGTESRIVAGQSDAPTMHVSDDGGLTWQAEPSPGFIESIAKGRVAEEYGLATDRGVYLHQYGKDINLGPHDFRPVFDLQSARELGGTGDLCFYGHSNTALERHCLPPLPPPPPPPPKERDVDITDPGEIDNGAASITPQDHVARLERGESKVVPYTVDLFKSPTPLDVYFLIDVSGSMSGTIEGVSEGMQDIINALTESKINTEFGVGIYRAYDDPPPYDRVLDVEPPGEALEKALESLLADGGGEETQLAALQQAATGAGQNEQLPLFTARIEPGQQANFRPDALKVIIHATDEVFSTLPPHPTFTDVIGDLNERGIEQVGLAIQVGDGGSADDPDLVQTTPRGGLLKVAKGTQTFAVEPVDCNDDGVPDIPAGEPLVCTVNPNRAQDAALMSGAIVDLLESVEDIGPVTVNVEAPDGVVPNITTQVFPLVDFKNPKPLNFDVMMTCPASGKEDEYPITINAEARGFILAETTATVKCIEPVIPRKPKVPPKPDPVDPTKPNPDDPVIFFPFPAFVPPIVRPPEVSPNPGPQSQSQTQAQQQAQAQGAMAAQEQKQPQLAYAYSKGLKAELAAERGGDEYQMSKYRSTSARKHEQMDPGVALMLSASAMTLAFGVAVQRQKRKVHHARRTRRSW